MRPVATEDRAETTRSRPMVVEIFLCVYYMFWSILNIFKNKIIFTQNQVRHEPSEILPYCEKSIPASQCEVTAALRA